MAIDLQSAILNLFGAPQVMKSGSLGANTSTGNVASQKFDVMLLELTKNG